MRKFAVIFSLLALVPLCLAACSALLERAESTGFYSTPTGMKAAGEFTRLYVHNQCYADVRATFPDMKGERKGERRSHFIPGRATSLVWTRTIDTLPLAVLSKQGTPDLRMTPRDIREKAVRDEWRIAGAFIESYHLTLCPKEPPLRDDEDNWLRPAAPGEMVDVYGLGLGVHFPHQPVVIKVNGVRVLHTESDAKGEVLFLLPAGTTGELAFFPYGEGRTYRIGADWPPRRTRPAAKGEMVIAEPERLSPEGSWE